MWASLLTHSNKLRLRSNGALAQLRCCARMRAWAKQTDAVRTFINIGAWNMFVRQARRVACFTQISRDYHLFLPGRRRRGEQHRSRTKPPLNWRSNSRYASSFVLEHSAHALMSRAFLCFTLLFQVALGSAQVGACLRERDNVRLLWATWWNAATTLTFSSRLYMFARALCMLTHN